MCRSSLTPENTTGRTNLYSASARTGAEEARLVSDQTDDEGVRRRTFAVRAYVLTEGSPWAADEAGERMADVVSASLPGTVCGYVGRVESASASDGRLTVRETYNGHPLTNGYEATVRLIIASRSR